LSTTQEFNRKVQKVQGQTLDTARKAQDVVVEAVTAWTVIANAIPGYDKFVNQFPNATEVIDSHYDFAGQILASQRDFVGRVVAATTPKAISPAPTKKTAPKGIASAPAKKSAPRKAATVAKKPAAVRTVTAK
jgi:hypothetical protein